VEVDSLRIAFAANRNIGLQSLRLLLEHQIEPVALLLPSDNTDGSSAAMRQLLPHVPELTGRQIHSHDVVGKLRALELDFILSVHFPYIFSPKILRLPRVGTLNLHPALLPFNRGWHTPSWAILENTPYGATLHWVDEGMDTGDIALQREVSVLPSDTADSLYARALAAELDVLREAIPLLKAGILPRMPQRGQGTTHVKAELDAVRRLDLEASMPVGDMLRIVRSLTTNRGGEAAWFELDGTRYLIQISIRRDVSEVSDVPMKRAA